MKNCKNSPYLQPKTVYRKTVDSIGKYPWKVETGLSYHLMKSYKRQTLG